MLIDSFAEGASALNVAAFAIATAWLENFKPVRRAHGCRGVGVKVILYFNKYYYFKYYLLIYLYSNISELRYVFKYLMPGPGPGSGPGHTALSIAASFRRTLPTSFRDQLKSFRSALLVLLVCL